jgi:4-amino-4-deoxy-L-arabinose transferase-like glycosyltransferase
MRRYRLDPGVVVFAAAAVLRVAWVLVRWSQAGPALEFSDEQLHWQLATNLVEQGTLVSDDGRYAARMPMYPLFLAVFAWLGEVGILLARLAQALLGAAAAWAVFRLADAALGRRAACLAGALACCDPYAIFFTNLLLTEVTFTLIAVGLVASAWRLVAQSAERNILAPIGLALLGAAAILLRPSAAGWIVVLWIILWLLDHNRLRATRRLGLCVLTLGVLMLPWGLRNRVVLGHPAWLSTNGGVTLYDAQGPQAKGDSDQSFLQRMPELARLNEVERDRALRRLAVAQMREDWGRVLRLAGVKFRRTWSLTPNIESYRGGVAGFVSAAFMLVVLVAAAVGLWRTRAKWKLHVLLWLPVVYFTLLHCLFIGSLRYRVPLMPFVEITAAAALVAIRLEEASAGQGGARAELHAPRAQRELRPPGPGAQRPR